MTPARGPDVARPVGQTAKTPLLSTVNGLRGGRALDNDDGFCEASLSDRSLLSAEGQADSLCDTLWSLQRGMPTCLTRRSRALWTSDGGSFSVSTG